MITTKPTSTTETILPKVSFLAEACDPIGFCHLHHHSHSI